MSETEKQKDLTVEAVAAFYRAATSDPAANQIGIDRRLLQSLVEEVQVRRRKHAEPQGPQTPAQLIETIAMQSGASAAALTALLGQLCTQIAWLTQELNRVTEKLDAGAKADEIAARLDDPA